MPALTEGVGRRYKIDGHGSGYTTGAKILDGAMVVLDTTNGKCLPAASGANRTRVVGVAVRGGDLNSTINVERGTYRFESTVANPVTRAAIGKPCYAANDNEVTLDEAGGILAGTVVDVEISGAQTYVWVNSRY